jgi:cell wall-associated NlpC family hydrolase
MLRRSGRLAACCLVVLLGLAAAPASAGEVPDGLASFGRLVEGDQGLAQAEKERWTALARERFAAAGLGFDFGPPLYAILSQARFDEVGTETAFKAAQACLEAIAAGAPVDETVELALLAFGTDIAPARLKAYALAMQAGGVVNLPLPVMQEMIVHAEEEAWPEADFTTFAQGLIEAGKQGLDAQKVALWMLVSKAQKLGTAEAIVAEILARPEKFRAGKPAEPEGPGPRPALDFDTFRGAVESFLGTPYVWGGGSREGTDCSGFTQLVLKENGYRIPRVSREQAAAGEAVERKALMLGDLVFFDTRGAGTITHVGLYLGGNLLAHASSSKGVTLVLLTDTYFDSRYVSARRVVTYTR